MDPNVSNRKATLSAAKQALLDKRLRGETGSEARAPKIPRRQQENHIPLSFAQQRLWLVDQFEPDGSAYNISRLMRFTGQLDRTALDNALEAIVARHETLRTTFSVVGGQPSQVIAPALPLSLPLEDLSHLPETARQDTLRRRATDEARRGFNLTEGPLLRVLLLRLGEHQHVLVLTIHHIISDAWSVELFMRELSTLYAACSKGQRSPLPELPIQYGDYAVWQRSWIESETMTRQLSYWKEQLAAAPSVLTLPADRQRPQQLNLRGSQRSLSLQKSLSERLKMLGRQENATLSMVVLAAFNVLLSRYCDQHDILVGTPVAGRNQVETEGLIGCFVNTLVMRTDLSGDPTFRELLRRVRECTLAAYANQDVPFERLVQELRPARGVGHSPFFQVMLDVQTGGEREARADNWVTENIEVDRGGARADLLLFVTEEPHSLDCWLEYSTDLFEPATVARLLGHFEILLQGIVENADRPISRLPLLTVSERQQLLVEWNQTAGEYPREKCLHELYESQARLNPEAVAVTFQHEQVTYEQLNGRANQLAHYLRRRGVGPDVLVGMCLERSVDMVVGVLGILKAGGAYLPLDPSYPSERLSVMIADSAVTVVLTQQQFLERLPSQRAEAIALDSQWEAIALESRENPQNESAPDNLAYVIYTSGSTGKPKGVLVTHQNVARLLATTQSSFNFSHQDVWTLFHSYAFDFSVWEIWGALLYGGRLVVVPYWVSRAPGEFYQLLCDEQVTVLNQTPSAFNQLIAAEPAAGAAPALAVRLIIFGGEALKPQSLAPWIERHGNERQALVNMYGITETTVHVTYRPVGAADLMGSSRSPIGQPLGDLQVHVLDSHQALVPIGVPGEMYVGGAGLARGYLHSPDLTAERFLPNPFSAEPGARLYRTGDLARRTLAGDIEYLGRADRQVKIRGFRIEPGDIEAALRRYDGVKDCAVVASGQETGQPALVAYVVVDPAQSLKLEGLRSFLRERLPDYMVPGAFVPLDRLPLTANGKLNRQALPGVDQFRSAMGDAFVAPRTPAEELLAGIWATVLKLPQVGVNDNFFDLGGHSLVATQVVARVRDAFRVELPLRRLFDAPTVAQLCEIIEEIGRAGLPPVVDGIARVSRDSYRVKTPPAVPKG